MADAPPITAFGLLVVAALMVILGLIDKIKSHWKRRE
jgi:hypothetical protein